MLKYIVNKENRKPSIQSHSKELLKFKKVQNFAFFKFLTYVITRHTTIQVFLPIHPVPAPSLEYPVSTMPIFFGHFQLATDDCDMEFCFPELKN